MPVKKGATNPLVGSRRLPLGVSRRQLMAAKQRRECRLPFPGIGPKLSTGGTRQRVRRCLLGASAGQGRGARAGKLPESVMLSPARHYDLPRASPPSRQLEQPATPASPAYEPAGRGFKACRARLSSNESGRKPGPSFLAGLRRGFAGNRHPYRRAGAIACYCSVPTLSVRSMPGRAAGSRSGTFQNARVAWRCLHTYGAVRHVPTR
jgi:hypothetical protein